VLCKNYARHVNGHGRYFHDRRPYGRPPGCRGQPGRSVSQIRAMESSQASYPSDVVPDGELLPLVKRCANRIYPLVVQDASDCLLDQAMRQTAPQLPIRIRDICALITKNTVFRVRSELRNCTDLENCSIVRNSAEPMQTESTHSSPLRLSGIVAEQSSNQRAATDQGITSCMVELFDEPNVHEPLSETNRATRPAVPVEPAVSVGSNDQPTTKPADPVEPAVSIGSGYRRRRATRPAVPVEPAVSIGSDDQPTTRPAVPVEPAVSIGSDDQPTTRPAAPVEPAVSIGSDDQPTTRPAVPVEPAVPIGSDDRRVVIHSDSKEHVTCVAETQPSDPHDGDVSSQTEYVTPRHAPEEGDEPQPESGEAPNNDEEGPLRSALEQYQAETFRALSTLLMNMKRRTRMQ